MSTTYRYTIHSGRQSQELYEDGTLRYMRPAGRGTYTTDLGTPMIRSGSIIGISCSLFFSDPGSAADGDLVAQIRVNDTVVFTDTLSFSTSGSVKVGSHATQSSGTDTFSSGDVIQMSLLGANSVRVNAQPTIVCEVEFD